MKKIILDWAHEVVQQHREVNRFRLKQAKRRSTLECAMGWTALVLFVLIAGAALYILFNPANFPNAIVTFTIPALIVDILGMLFTIWQLFIKHKPDDKLESITKDQIEGYIRLHEMLKQ